MKGCTDGTPGPAEPTQHIPLGNSPLPPWPGALPRFVARGLTGRVSLHFDLRVHPPRLLAAGRGVALHLSCPRPARLLLRLLGGERAS